MAMVTELGQSSVQLLCDHLSEKEKWIDCKIVDYKMQQTSTVPAGFLATHQGLRVQFAYNDSNGKKQHETLHFFIKSMPVHAESITNYLDELGVFNKEIGVYCKILPHIKLNFEEIAPQCYIAEKHFIIFEDLVQKGYKMAGKRDGILDYTHLSIAVKTLALMHAQSLIFESQTGKRLNEIYSKELTENSYPKDIQEDHVRNKNFRNAVAVFLEILKSLPKYKSDVNFISEQFKIQMQRIFDFAQTSTEYPNVFSHGDLWANNIMFKYDANEQIRPIACRFVDFQLARYCPPMLDLVTMLTIPTSREFRKLHFLDLIGEYYSNLKKYLQQQNIHIDDVLPEKEFYKGIEEFRIAGLIESCLFSHLTVLPTIQTQKLTGSSDGFNDFFSKKRVQICMQAFQTDDTYRVRLLDMFEDFIDCFIIPNKYVLK